MGRFKSSLLLVGIIVSALSGGATPPFLWLAGPDFGKEGIVAFRKALPEAEIDPGAPDTQAILARLRTQPDGASPQVLMFNGRPVAGAAMSDYAADLKSIVGEARRRRIELLWFDAPGGGEANQTAKQVMDAHGVMMVEFDAFSRSLRAKDAAADTPLTAVARRRQGEFLAESAMQWWAACAASNPETEHIKLWPALPPAYEFAGPERVNRSARIDYVSEPELVRFLPKKRDRAPAVIFFPGGGYGYIGFLRNAKELAERLDAQGIAVIGLKYRMGRPVEVPLMDAERAVRYVRSHADEWGIDPNSIGVAGQSAGANLVLNLASRFDAGDAKAGDLIERASSRPDFMVVLTSWNFGKTISTFTFPADTPPVFLRHARNDSGFGIAEQVVAQMKERNIPLNHLFLDKGGHGAFELSPENPGASWPDDLVIWLRQRGLLSGRVHP